MAPALAVIGGSQAHRLLSEKPIAAGRLGPVDTPFGPSQPIFRITVGQAEGFFLPRHGEHGYVLSAPFVNYRANLYALKELGIQQILAWSGPGAINTAFSPGDFIVPDDVIDETRGRAGTFYEGCGFGFIRHSPVFCPEMTDALVTTLRSLGLAVRRGATYVCTAGPRLETPAEIRKYASFGADLVGMTLAPECFLARELEMCYVALCYVTNRAEGLASRPYEAGRLFEGLSTEPERAAVEHAVEQLPAIIRAFLPAAATLPRACPCAVAMERYRRQGDIGDDWHDWVRPPAR